MKSVWLHSIEAREYPPRPKLGKHVKADVLVVGAGMAGILTAHALAQTGANVIVAEANRVGLGITKNTTAKVTAQHSLIYADIIKARGTDAAAQYFSANQDAKDAIRKLSKDADFETKTAYIYTTCDMQKLDREERAYRQLGIDGELCTVNLPVSTLGALSMRDQGQFNPLKFLLPIARSLTIYEQTMVQDIDGQMAITNNGAIEADHIVLSTHFPMINIPGLYFLKLYQHRSYVVAIQNGPDLRGMYVDERIDGHSFRNYQDLLLIGGGDHRTGKRGGAYAELRTLAARVYPDKNVWYEWATQDCITLDGLPYIGRHRASTPRLYVATGFNKWGMTGAMVAARVLTELITTGHSEYSALFSPRRPMRVDKLLLNAAHAAGGLLSFGKRCPHMGCKLHWNSCERTWDCSCHGSRFDEDGVLIDNPAKRGAHV